MREVKVGKVYKHFKGNYYYVLGVGKDCDTCEDVVIYRALYDDLQIWVRPLDEFLSKTDKEKYPDAQEYRFEAIDLIRRSMLQGED